MKKYLLLTALFLCASANAGHHRVHVIEFIDSMNVNIDLMQESLITYEASQNPTALEAGFIEAISIYSDTIQDEAAIGRALLEDPASDLDEVRLIFNQKRFSTTPHSIAFQLGALMYYAGLLSETSPSPELSVVIQKLMLAWMELDKIHWHIQDAIREEIYLDPDFQ